MEIANIKPKTIFYNIQLLRFVAAILVLFFHLQWMPSGYKGVDLFFIISGFIITHQLQPHNLDFSYPAKTYFINRCTKIFTLYWLVLIAIIILGLQPINKELLATFFLVPKHKSVLHVTWSLSYELYFYALYGFVYYILPTKYRINTFLLLFALASIYAGLQCYPNFKAIPLLNFVIGKNLWQFLLGIVLYYLFINKPKSILNNIAIFFIFSLSFILIDVPYGKNHSSIVYGYLGFFMIYASFNLSQSNKLTYLKKASNILGESSYALYLISPVLYLLFDNNFFIAVASIILAILLNILVENKLLYLVRKIFLGD